MTESTIENLLQQMSLKVPSPNLDQQVGRCLGETTVTASSGSSRHRSWGLLSTVAISCLVLGAIAGHLLANTTSSLMPQAEATFESSQDAVEVDVAPTELVGAADYKELLSKMQGPSVTMLCAMKTESTKSVTKTEQCLTCHDGMVAAKSSFRELHMSNPGFATCMWCHDTKELNSVGGTR